MSKVSKIGEIVKNSVNVLSAIEQQKKKNRETVGVAVYSTNDEKNGKVIK